MTDSYRMVVGSAHPSTSVRELPAASDAPDVRDVTEQIYQQHGLKIFGLAARMLGNEADAEDITQEVLLQVVRRLDTFRGDCQVSTWLYRVTVNAVLALRRKRATAKERQLPGAGEDGGSGWVESGGPRCPAGTPEDEVLDGELRGKIEAAIARLPAVYRDPFILSDVEGLSNGEIGRMLGLSIPAVKSRLHRARMMLKGTLQPYMSEREVLV